MPWRNRLEIMAVLLCGGAHLAWPGHAVPHMCFIVVVALGWAVYIAARCLKDRNQLARWGFSKQGLKQSALASAAVAAIGVAALALIVFCTPLRERAIVWHPNMLLCLLLYPIWGLFQQFCVQALVAGNIADSTGKKATLVVPFICGPLFGLVHAPEWPLVACTTLLGTAFCFIYLRWRNLWPLGVVHGWLGVPAYFWLMGIDPLAKALG